MCFARAAGRVCFWSFYDQIRCKSDYPSYRSFVVEPLYVWLLLISDYVVLCSPVASDHTPSSLDDDEGNSHVLFNNIPDPAGRYWTLKTNIANRSYEMAIPPVFEANGRRVHPTQYKSVTPEGTIDPIRSLMKV